MTGTGKFTTTEKLIIAAVATLTAPVCAIAIVLVLTTVVGDPTQSPTPAPSLTPTMAPTLTLLPALTPTPNPDAGDDIGAIAICKKFVSQRLTAPTDAQWPGPFDEAPEVRQTGLDTWRVASWVDAPNALGVHIRITYACTVRYLGDDQWRLEVLDLQEPGGDSQAEPPTPAPAPTKAKCRVGGDDTYIEVDCP
jgi:hypothetical protein